VSCAARELLGLAGRGSAVVSGPDGPRAPVVERGPGSRATNPVARHRRTAERQVAASAVPIDHAVRIAAASPRPSSAIAISRIRYFWILPVTVIGNSLVIFQ